ncbi:MAG: GIY-YIG nuclease family protein [Candidatus Bathyarchaeia archaeon]
MNSKSLYSRIVLLDNWLKNQEYKSHIELPQTLSWMELQAATGRHIPRTPGFYIVKLRDSSDILYIGKTDNLNRRISFLRGAIRTGTSPHSGGKRLRREMGADLSRFEIWWLETPNPQVASLFERYLILSFYEEQSSMPMGNAE